MSNPYRAITGRRYDLSSLAEVEREALAEVVALFEDRPSWEEFSQVWPGILQRRLPGRVELRSPLRRVCQDMEMRLGIAEGRIASPDYRDRIADLIEERFSSRYEFCKASGIDQGHLSRVLSGKKHLATDTFFRVLEVLGLEIEIVDRSEVSELQEIQPPTAESLSERLRLLERRQAVLLNLRARAKSCEPEQRGALLKESASLFKEDDELAELRQRLAAGDEFDGVLASLLERTGEQLKVVSQLVSEEASEVVRIAKAVG